MGGAAINNETALLLPNKIPTDHFNLTYITYLILGAGCVLPWTTFITAIDYFSHIYPQTHINRIFAVAYSPVAVAGLVAIVFFGRRSDARFRINVGLGLNLVSLISVPLLEVFYLRGRVGLFNGFYVTVGAVVMCGVAHALVQSGVVGSAGELPEKYMQGVVAGIAGSGVMVSVLRIVTKAIYARDDAHAHAHQPLTQSAILYFAVAISFIILCIFLYNATTNLPLMKHHQNLKNRSLSDSINRSTFWEILSRIKVYVFGIVTIFVIVQSIFPGYITEDVHSEILRDWYPITLITAYYLFHLFGKYLASVYLIKDPKITFGFCVGNVVFYPLFVGCLHGPEFLRSEIPVGILTCVLGLSAGYLTAVIMILAPKLVPFQHAEVAGIFMAMFLDSGLAIGSVLAWFWVI